MENAGTCGAFGHKAVNCTKDRGRGGTRVRGRGRGAGLNAMEESNGEVNYFDVDYKKDTLFYLSSSAAMPTSKVSIGNLGGLVAGWDSGASINALSNQSFLKLKDSIRRRLDTRSTIPVKMANGTTTRALGDLDLDVNFGATCSRMRFHVIEGLPRDIENVLFQNPPDRSSLSRFQ